MPLLRKPRQCASLLVPRNQTPPSEHYPTVSPMSTCLHGKRAFQPHLAKYTRRERRWRNAVSPSIRRFSLRERTSVLRDRSATTTLTDLAGPRPGPPIRNSAARTPRSSNQTSGRLPGDASLSPRLLVLREGRRLAFMWPQG